MKVLQVQTTMMLIWLSFGNNEKYGKYSRSLVKTNNQSDGNLVRSCIQSMSFFFLILPLRRQVKKKRSNCETLWLSKKKEKIHIKYVFVMNFVFVFQFHLETQWNKVRVSNESINFEKKMNVAQQSGCLAACRIQLN